MESVSGGHMMRIIERGVSITKPNIIQSNSTIHIKIWAHSAILCVNRMRPWLP
jgi:hypothetical protein